MSAVLTERQLASLRLRIEAAVHVVEGSDCHVWTRVLRYGYGSLGSGSRKLLAHRAAYEVYVGPIPAGLELDHLCRNRACVNPSHLEPVDGAENRRRQGAAVTHCPHGHEYTPENTMLTPGSCGRVCRQCKGTRARAAYRAANPMVRGEQPRGACLRGHPPTEANLYVAPSGATNCRPCHRERAASYRKRQGK